MLTSRAGESIERRGRSGPVVFDSNADWTDRSLSMNEVTQILAAIEQGDPSAPDRLLPLVYDELRKLATARLAREKPGQTLQATALVHEAYLRLVDTNDVKPWNSRGHFFGAAAEAMRRILVENARRIRRIKHGGAQRRVDLNEAILSIDGPAEELLAVDEALERLALEEPQAAELVKLHYFGGLTIEEAAEVLGISPRKGYRIWAYARAWLFRCLGDEQPGGD
jgi:RNA polymerase sigma factor (TIGR02999 family)